MGASGQLKRMADGEITVQVKKRRTNTSSQVVGNMSGPPGMEWDDSNWSCCYDAMFTVLYNIWVSNPRQWTSTFRSWNPTLRELSVQFRKFSNGEIDMNTARDRVRLMLNSQDAESFPYGQLGGDMVQQVAYTVATARADAQVRTRQCTVCDIQSSRESMPTYIINCARPNQMRHESTSAWLNHDMLHDLDDPCECGERVFEERTFGMPVSLLMFVWNEPDMDIDPWIVVAGTRRPRKLFLRGIIYLRAFHFTARLFDREGNTWYHDGAVTGSTCIAEGYMADLDRDTLNANSVLAVYSK